VWIELVLQVLGFEFVVEPIEFPFLHDIVQKIFDRLDKTQKEKTGNKFLKNIVGKNYIPKMPPKAVLFIHFYPKFIDVFPVVIIIGIQ
jgi:hypothetical protein